MLLELKIRNFKSFKDEIVFKMTPAPKIKDINHCVLTYAVKNKTYKALPSAVIYGPNSSGKSNIIGAMDVLKKIILRGNINNADENTPNMASYKLELIPNIANEKVEPVAFYIKFTSGGFLFEYYLEFMAGMFLEKDYDREITYEKLMANGKSLFERIKNSIEIENFSIWNDYKVDGFDMRVARNISCKNLDRNELFLTTKFRHLFSVKLVDIIIDWFKNKTEIIYRADSVHVTPVIQNKERAKFFILDEINDFLDVFGCSGEIAYSTSKEDENTYPVTLLKTPKRGFALPADIFESYGTVRFLNILPFILSAIKIGKVVFIDEFDSSIHPMAIMSIISVFHNNEININGAQLVFNTHNPIFLNKRLFRRDEIKFVERDDFSGFSTHYSLSDFGTEKVRNSTDYMKNYFINRYGAIKNIDFSEPFLKFLKEDQSEVKPDNEKGT